jgi:hypothetical protein
MKFETFPLEERYITKSIRGCAQEDREAEPESV